MSRIRVIYVINMILFYLKMQWRYSWNLAWNTEFRWYSGVLRIPKNDMEILEHQMANTFILNREQWSQLLAGVTVMVPRIWSSADVVSISDRIDYWLLWPRPLLSQSKWWDAFKWAYFTLKTMDLSALTYHYLQQNYSLRELKLCFRNHENHVFSTT